MTITEIRPDDPLRKERERCAAIVQLAREGEIDGDFRSIIHRIETGWNPSTLEDEKRAEAHQGTVARATEILGAKAAAGPSVDLGATAGDQTHEIERRYQAGAGDELGKLQASAPSPIDGKR